MLVILATKRKKVVKIIKSNQFESYIKKVT